MSNVQERVNKFVEYKCLSAQAFERICGLGNGSMKRMSEGTRQLTYSKISNAFPELNIEWLKTGNGEMLVSDAQSSPPVSIRQQAGAGSVQSVGIGGASSSAMNGVLPGKASMETPDSAGSVQEALAIMRDIVRSMQEVIETNKTLAASNASLSQTTAALAQNGQHYHDAYNRVMSKYEEFIVSTKADIQTMIDAQTAETKRELDANMAQIVSKCRTAEFPAEYLKSKS